MKSEISLKLVFYSMEFPFAADPLFFGVGLLEIRFFVEFASGLFLLLENLLQHQQRRQFFKVLHFCPKSSDFLKKNM